jgi:hypothetical protein
MGTPPFAMSSGEGCGTKVARPVREEAVRNRSLRSDTALAAYFHTSLSFAKTSVRRPPSKSWKDWSSKKRAARLNAIREACQNYINVPLREHLSQLLRELLESANLAAEAGRIEPDLDDSDQQSLLLWYPTVTADGAAYVRPEVAIAA